jgi:curved DNA-binding protein CbpA
MTADPSISSSDVVRFREVGGDFETRAEVRNVYAGEDRIRRLNLRFLDWPAPDRLARTDDMRPSSDGLEAAAPPADTPADRPRGLSRGEIQKAYLGLRQRDHFALLGVPRDADTETIKAAYARLAQRYSPDAGRDRGVSDLFKEIGAVRLKLGEAHEVLSDPSRRADYERSLGLSPDGRRPADAAQADAKAERREPRPDDAAGTTAPGNQRSSPPPAAKTESGKMAALETAISEGRRLLGEGEPWEAIQILEGAVRRTQGKSRLRQQALVLLAGGVSQNPKWRRRAEGILKEVIEEDPENVQASLQLATLYESAGLRRKAVRAFRRVVELDPGNKLAQAGLAKPRKPA